jgi:hypothetical protein
MPIPETEEDAHILRVLEPRTSQELISFWNKLWRIKGDRSERIRFHILCILIVRHPLDVQELEQLSPAGKKEFAQASQAMRVSRLASGNWRFGCEGTHRGIGEEYCPFEPHHHHDAFCPSPTKHELELAGIDPKKFKRRSRA